MIKIIFCLRRLPHLSVAAFQDYWLNTHAPLVKSVAHHLNMAHYVQSHAFSDPRVQPALDARGTQIAPYDGVAEIYWRSMEDLLAVGQNPEARRAGRLLLEDEKRFIDLPNSPIFYAETHEIIPLA